MGGENGVPVFDKAGMLERMLGDEELARLVIDGFLQDIPVQIGQLKGFLSAGDLPSVTRQAHSIKSASGNVGGEALRVLAFKMETAGRSGDMSFIEKRFSELEEQFDSLKEAIEEEMAVS